MAEMLCSALELQIIEQKLTSAKALPSHTPNHSMYSKASVRIQGCKMSSSGCLKNPISNGIRGAEHKWTKASSWTGMTVTSFYNEVRILSQE